MEDQTIFDVPKIFPTNRKADTSAASVVMPDIKTDANMWFRKGWCYMLSWFCVKNCIFQILDDFSECAKTH